MANLSSLEKRQLEDLFNMSSGHVMNFSNRSFEDLFRSTVNVDIYAERYKLNGPSKANRLRSFWNQESDVVVGKVLGELIRIFEYENADYNKNIAYVPCCRIVGRLIGGDKNHQEDKFLQMDFGTPSFGKLPIESAVIPILQSRYKEVLNCLEGNSPLAAIILCGSMLEGVLLGVGLKQSALFVQSSKAPKTEKNNVVKPIQSWTLSELINVACDLSILGVDVSKFSHALRDFRNYIHPYKQISSNFNPDKHTAKICFQVFVAAMSDLNTVNWENHYVGNVL